MAWCLCNRTDLYILIDFLMAVNIIHLTAACAVGSIRQALTRSTPTAERVTPSKQNGVFQEENKVKCYQESTC